MRYLIAALALVIPASAQHPAMHTREFFYVGGQYTGAPGNEVMTGQMYVELLRPQRVTRKYPLVFIHGLGQTATNWIGTPDGAVKLNDLKISMADLEIAAGMSMAYTIDEALGRAKRQARILKRAERMLANAPKPIVKPPRLKLLIFARSSFPSCGAFALGGERRSLRVTERIRGTQSLARAIRLLGESRSGLVVSRTCVVLRTRLTCLIYSYRHY